MLERTDQARVRSCDVDAIGPATPTLGAKLKVGCTASRGVESRFHVGFRP